MKEFEVSADDLFIKVKVVRDELHDTYRYLLVIHRSDFPRGVDEYRFVETFRLMEVISSYLF